jgi:hypothetical protein
MYPDIGFIFVNHSCKSSSWFDPQDRKSNNVMFSKYFCWKKWRTNWRFRLKTLLAYAKKSYLVFFFKKNAIFGPKLAKIDENSDLNIGPKLTWSLRRSSRWRWWPPASSPPSSSLSAALHPAALFTRLQNPSCVWSRFNESATAVIFE